MNQIVSFIKVLELNSFSNAARSLGVSPPVVSKRISALENYLGILLFRRTTRTLEPTEAGLQLGESLGPMLEHIDHALEELMDGNDQVQGHLSVIMPTYLVEPALYKEVIPSFLQEHPNVQLQLRVLDDPLSRLSDSFDLLVLGRLPERQMPDSQLVRRNLVKRHGAVYGSPSYLSQFGTPHTPEELSQHNCLSYLNRRWRFVSPQGEAQTIEAKGNIATNSTAVLKELAIQGEGLVYSIPSFFAEETAHHQLVEVLQDYTKGSHLEINLLYPQLSHQPARTRAFIQKLEAHFIDGSSHSIQ
jgi:DNA-binding transcriptional LysR family regulator